MGTFMRRNRKARDKSEGQEEETPCVYKTSNTEPTYVQVTKQTTSEVLNHPGTSVILVNILVLLGP